MLYTESMTFKDFIFTKAGWAKADFFFKNEVELSPAQIRIVFHVVKGLAMVQIQDILCLAEKTVKFHLTNIRKKLNKYRIRNDMLPLHDRKRNLNVNLLLCLPFDEMFKEYSNPFSDKSPFYVYAHDNPEEIPKLKANNPLVSDAEI